MNFESNLDLATASITEFGYSTSRPYYLSEVLFIQQMQTDIYSTNTEGSNIYNQLDTDFKQEDINQDLICPKYNFYTQFNDPITQPDSYYETSVSTPSIFLLASQPNPEINLYFRFSYIDNMIEFIISKGNINFATNNGNGIINFGASGVIQTMTAQNAWSVVIKDTDQNGDPILTVVDETVIPDDYVFLVALTNGQSTYFSIHSSRYNHC